MSGQRSRHKGYRVEAKVRDIAKEFGISCKRVPLSGSAPGWKGDLRLAGRSFEVKARGKGFRSLYRWLESYFGLILAADRQEPLAVLRLNDFLLILKGRIMVLRNNRSIGPSETGISKTSDQVCGTGFEPAKEGMFEKGEKPHA